MKIGDWRFIKRLRQFKNLKKTLKIKTFKAKNGNFGQNQTTPGSKYSYLIPPQPKYPPQNFGYSRCLV